MWLVAEEPEGIRYAGNACCGQPSFGAGFLQCYFATELEAHDDLCAGEDLYEGIVLIFMHHILFNVGV